MRTFGILTAVTLVCCPASAQAPNPDVVLTQDGGMVRGSIVESIPGDHVTIVLPTGMTRVFPWGHVRYAGPESERPGSATTPPPVSDTIFAPHPSGASRRPRRRYRPEPIVVRLRSTPEGALFEEADTTVGTVDGFLSRTHVRLDHFARLCRAPCAASIRPGSHRFSISLGRALRLRGSFVEIYGPGEVRAQLSNLDDLRIAGYVSMIAGVVLGGAVLGITELAVGLGNAIEAVVVAPGLAVLGFLVGMAFVLQNDSVDVMFVPDGGQR